MSHCIYCRCDLPAVVPKEHVIPQLYGKFTPDLTLRCVCKECNHFFGSKLEWPMMRQSVEGMRRIQFGLKGQVGGIKTKGIEPVIGAGYICYGARVAIRSDDQGNKFTIILPQVGARRTKDEPFEWCIEQDLRPDWAAKFPKNTEFHVIGGENDADSQRLMKKWMSVCPTFKYAGQIEKPFKDDEKILIHAEHVTTPTTVRCLCKITFNYLALVKGPDFALLPSFDSIRAFVRYDLGGAEDRAYIKRNWIIAQELIRDERWTDGHVLTIEGRPKDGVVLAQVALFNSIPYQIPLCRDYTGEWFAKGYHFNIDNRKVSELQVQIVEEGFDPSSVLGGP